jgi:hypothetical protein
MLTFWPYVWQLDPGHTYDEHLVLALKTGCDTVLVKDRIILTPMACLELCTDRISGFMRPDKPSSFCNYYVELHLPASCGDFTFWRENETEGQDFIPGVGARFRHSRDLRMVVIRESLRESSVWRVGHVLSPAWCISIRVAATLSIMSNNLSLQSSYSMSNVLLMDSRSWMWACSRLLYHYVIAYLWRWHGSTFCLFLLVLVCRCKHSTWLKKSKWLN